MADILSLKRARKAKAKTEKEDAAAANRAKFGRTKAERQLGEADRLRDSKRLDGHRLAGSDPGTKDRG